MSKRTTIREVAMKSGVSTATVSRVVSGSGFVNDELRDKVLKVAKTMGYRQKRIVQPPVSLANLEVLVFDTELDQLPAETFTSQVIQGIQGEALRLMDAKVITQSWNQPRLDSEFLNTLSQRDGVIVLGRLDKHVECLDQIQELNIPLVLAGEQIPGRTLNCVNTEDNPACVQLTDYLVGMGFRRFGWLGADVGVQHFEDRLHLIRGRLLSKGIDMLPKDCRFVQESWPKDILEVMDQWIEEGDLPEVIIVPSGFPVVFVQRSLASHGLKCPDDLSIACFNNYRYADVFHPTPTRMATFPDEIGRNAYRRILEMVRDEEEREKVKTILIPMKFIEGESLKPPRQ